MSKHSALKRDVLNLADVLHELFRVAEVSHEEEAEILFIAMYAFALELGFNSRNRREIVSSKWRHRHNYACKLEHQTCPNVQCTLLYAPLTADYGIVYGFINDEEVCNVQIEQKEFLSQEINATSKEIDMYKDIEKFERTLKDGILFRMLFFAQQSVGISPTFGFMTAPNETVLRILEYLPAKNLLTISETNKELYDLAQLEYLWERLFKKDFPHSEDEATDSKSWKDLYKEKYLQRKKRREMIRNASIVLPRHYVPRLPDAPILMPRPYVPRFPDPLMPFPSGGIIGGDPDRFPNLGLHPDVAQAFPNFVRRQPPSRFPHFPHFSM